jgi:sn-glycerol 3-phosphate transport system substrate-binding protein
MKKIQHFLCLQVFLLSAFLISFGQSIFLKALASSKETIRISTGFKGPIEEAFAILMEDFKQANPEIEIVIASKGNYMDAFKAAFSKEAPEAADIYHVSEFGSPSIIMKMEEQKNFIPVGKVDPSVNSIKFLGGLNIAYGSKEGMLYAFPFNPSMGIVYFNVDLFEKAKARAPQNFKDVQLEKLATWKDIITTAEKVTNTLNKVFPQENYKGFGFPWTAAYTYEYFTSMAGTYIASHKNGFSDPLKARLELHKNKKVVRFFNKLSVLHQKAIYHYVSDFSNKAEEDFALGKTFILMQGSGRLNDIKKEMEKAGTNFNLAFGPLPYDSTVIQKPFVPKLGGGAFWITKDSDGIRKFLSFLADSTVQAKWCRLTGYMPSTQEAHHILEEEGFYKGNPHVVAAIQQVLNRSFGEFTHTRLGNYGDIRGKLFNELFVKFLRAKNQKAEAFLKEFDQEGNKLLEAFEKSNSQEPIAKP